MIFFQGLARFVECLHGVCANMFDLLFSSVFTKACAEMHCVVVLNLI